MLLREWRKAKGLNTTQGAEFFNTSIGWLNDVERGNVWPSPERIAHIEAATSGAVVAEDHWRAWSEANPDKLSVSRADGRRAAKAYRPPVKRKGAKRGGKP